MEAAGGKGYKDYGFFPGVNFSMSWFEADASESPWDVQSKQGPVLTSRDQWLHLNIKKSCWFGFRNNP